MTLILPKHLAEERHSIDFADFAKNMKTVCPDIDLLPGGQPGKPLVAIASHGEGLTIVPPINPAALEQLIRALQRAFEIGAIVALGGNPVPPEGGKDENS